MATTVRKHTTIAYRSVRGTYEAISRRGHVSVATALRLITGDVDRTSSVHVRHYSPDYRGDRSVLTARFDA